MRVWPKISDLTGLRAAALVGVAISVAVVTGCSSSSSPSPAAATSRAPASSAPAFDLATTHPTVWLCRPDLARNPCAAGLDATVISPAGKRAVVPFVAAKDPKVDCFYIYPTLSEAKTVAAPLAPEPAAVAVTKAQVGRFQSVCRLYVPVYRQFTRAALTGLLTGHPLPKSVQANAAADVVSAWHDYLDHDNHGRGVILLGHSQGAGQLISLLKREVDQSPAERKLLVAAYALGGNLLVPQGKDVGGDLQNIPACRSATQHGCVVAYSMFNTLPPAAALFGRVPRAATNVHGTSTAGMQVLCVNPAALQGGTAPIRPYYPTQTLGGSHLAGQAKASLPVAPTGFVAFPGQLTAACRSESGASWLQIDHPHPGSGANNAPVAATLGPIWGLHLFDFNADQGDLISLAAQQAASWS